MFLPVEYVGVVDMLESREQLVGVPQHGRFGEEAAALAVPDEAVQRATVGIFHLNEEVLLVLVADVQRV